MSNRDKVQSIAALIGSTLMDNSAQWKNRFTIKSETSSRIYTVAQRRTDNTWGCSCPGWRHHRRCKHLTNILSRLAALPPNADVLGILSSARAAFIEDGGDPNELAETMAAYGNFLGSAYNQPQPTRSVDLGRIK